MAQRHGSPNKGSAQAVLGVTGIASCLLCLVCGAGAGFVSSRDPSNLAFSRQRRARRNKSRLRRALQYNTTTCQDLLQLTYATTYQQSNNPCSCALVDGFYEVVCDYGYCPDCAGGQCAVQSTHDYYTQTGQLQRGTYCIAFTSGRFLGTTNCFDFGRSDSVGRSVTDDSGLFCDLRVNTTLCDSCHYSRCVGGDDDGSMVSVQPSFDCGNIVYNGESGLQANGPIANLCSSTDDTYPLDSPFVAFRQNELNFDSCYAQPYQENSLTISPSKSPSTAAPTGGPVTPSPTKNPTLPPSTVPTSSRPSPTAPYATEKPSSAMLVNLVPEDTPNSTSTNGNDIASTTTRNGTVPSSVKDDEMTTSAARFSDLWFVAAVSIGLVILMVQETKN